MINLEKLQWKEIKLNKIFKSIVRGKVSDLKNSENGDMLIIAAAGENEGFSCFADVDSVAQNAMTISFNGVGTGKAFVHNYYFNLNSDCGLVIPYEKMPIEVLRFIAISINMNKDKFNYGYKANENRILRQTVLLPVDSSGKLDYTSMKQIISLIENEKKEKYRKYCLKELAKLGEVKKIININEKKTATFFISQIFNIPQRGKRIISKNFIDGNIPVVSSAGGNNGVIAFVGNKKNVRIYDDCLSVANGGVSAGFAFYHPYEFIGTDHITHFKNDNLNKYQYLFIATIIRKQMHDKYDFSREMTDPRIKREILLLPIDENGNPDYEYMEQYIKNIMIKKYRMWLEYEK